jgi:hypothetical protein
VNKKYAFKINYRPFFHDHIAKLIAEVEDEGEGLSLTQRLMFTTDKEIHVPTFKTQISHAYGMDGHVVLSIEGGLVE